MKIPREARKLSKELFMHACAGGRIDAARVTQIADNLIAHKPRHYVQILKEFTRLVRLELLKTHAVIESAVALDSTTSSEVRKDLAARFGPHTTFEFRVNPALIGGLRVKVGSDVWDGSIKCRLESLRNAA